MAVGGLNNTTTARRAHCFSAFCDVEAQYCTLGSLIICLESESLIGCWVKPCLRWTWKRFACACAIVCQLSDYPWIFRILECLNALPRESWECMRRLSQSHRNRPRQRSGKKNSFFYRVTMQPVVVVVRLCQFLALLGFRQYHLFQGAQQHVKTFCGNFKPLTQAQCKARRTILDSIKDYNFSAIMRRGYISMEVRKKQSVRQREESAHIAKECCGKCWTLKKGGNFIPFIDFSSFSPLTIFRAFPFLGSSHCVFFLQ